MNTANDHQPPTAMRGHPLRQRWRRGLFVAMAMAFCVPVVAQDTPSLDDLLGIPQAQAPAQVSEAEQPEQADSVQASDPPSETTKQAPSGGFGGSGGGGFGGVLTEMARAQEQLLASVGLPAQRRQQAVLARLDQLIAEAKQQQQQQSSSSSASQSQQQQQQSSQNQPGQQQQQQASPQQNPQQGNQGDQTQASAGSPDEQEPLNAEAPLQELRAGWGQLPPRVRDALLQGQDQRVSAVYRRLTQAYFQRLAELSTEQTP